MEGNAIPVSVNTTVIVKCSGDLFLSGEETAEIRFQSSEDRIRVNQSNDTVYVETHASIDLSVPRQASVIIERVGGSAFLEDLDSSLTIQKIGGDLALRRMGQVRIEKIGGSCLTETVAGGLVVGKIGGDLTARDLSGVLEIGSIGGTLDLVVGAAQILEGRAGGDVRIYFTQGLGEKVMLKAGGTVELYLSPNTSGKFALISNGEVVDVRLNNQQEIINEKFETRRFEFTLGDGAANVDAIAGGDVRISDKETEPRSIANDLDRMLRVYPIARVS